MQGIDFFYPITDGNEADEKCHDSEGRRESLRRVTRLDEGKRVGGDAGRISPM